MIARCLVGTLPNDILAHEGGKTIPTFQEFLVAEAETETGQKMTAGFPERERLAMVENS